MTSLPQTIFSGAGNQLTKVKEVNEVLYHYLFLLYSHTLNTHTVGNLITGGICALLVYALWICSFASGDLNFMLLIQNTRWATVASNDRRVKVGFKVKGPTRVPGDPLSCFTGR